MFIVPFIVLTTKTCKMKNIKRDHAELNYQEAGSGEITLLFVHGAYLDQTCWKNQVQFFEQNYKVVTLDLPGHGKSGNERVDWSIRKFAEDVIAVIWELNLKNVILIGHSMGATINLIAATLYPKPVLGFIAVDMFKNAANPLPDEYQHQAEHIVEKLTTDFANTNEQYARMALLTDQTPPAITEAVVNNYRHANQQMAIATTPEIFSIYQAEKELLPKLRFKLYLINVDYIPTNEAPLRQYAGSGYEVFHMKGTSHFPMLENSPVLNKLLYEAIQEIAVDIMHEA